MNDHRNPPPKSVTFNEDGMMIECACGEHYQVRLTWRDIYIGLPVAADCPSCHNVHAVSFTQRTTLGTHP